jgi:dephospho-CoA kinase
MQTPAPACIIGLTGGVGAGKSTAEALLRAQHVPVADADQWAHDVLAHDRAAQRAIQEYFLARHGVDPLRRDGSVDRAALARIVFGDAAALAALEAIVHPRVRAMAQQWIAAQRAAQAPLAVMIVPLLFESGMDAMCAATLALVAPPAVRARRLQRARGWTPAHSAARMRRQLDDTARAQRATYVVSNAGSRAAFARALAAVLDDLRRDPQGAAL